MPRYFKLTDTRGGPLPPHPFFKIGAIIRVPRINSRKPDGPIWNAETGDWVSPVWTEVRGPRVKGGGER